MCANDRISNRIKSKQSTAFRLAERDYAQKHKDIAEDAGISVNSVGAYARGETVMGLAAFHKLCGVVPNELLSLMLPAGFQVVHTPENLDHDEVMRAIAEYSMLKMDAHRKDSVDGEKISECEDAALRSKIASITGKAA